MTDTYSPEAMLRSRAAAAEDFRVRVEAVLERAGIPTASIEEVEEFDTGCARSGYLISSYGPRFASIAILGRRGTSDAVRQGERDALMQQAYAALSADGLDVIPNEFGHLRAVEHRREAV